MRLAERLESRLTRRLVLVAIVIGFAIPATLAMRHTSATFDEILFPAAGARGYHTGKFDMLLDHPPLMQYLYGLPVALSHPVYPDEHSYKWDYKGRYYYAQNFFWTLGNNPEKLAFLARLVGVLMGALLICGVYVIARRCTDTKTALIAALLIAFVPDVLAHSGVSYNDVPLALIILISTYALDAAVRDPNARSSALAGFASALAIAVKFSGIIVAPILFALIVAELVGGRLRDRDWWVRFGRATPIFLIVLYLTLVAIYLGDFKLQDFWFGLQFNLTHAEKGHGAEAVLLGHRSLHGWWYFFPVVFFLKTSAALHMLLVIALYGGYKAMRGQSVKALVESPLRAAAIGGAGFLASTMVTHLNIGFRHALPVLPFACILIAAGIVAAARSMPRVWRFAIPLFAWHVIAPLTFYPYFLSYLSEYTGPVEKSYETLVDSSLDWGQGLLALRDFMHEYNIPSVYLSYFGSALPAGYGIHYRELPSFFPLPHSPGKKGDAPPRFIAVSLTNMSGNYLGGAFPNLRKARPIAVLAGSIWVFEDKPLPR